MPVSLQNRSCAQSESLVLIEVLPLCRIDALGASDDVRRNGADECPVSSSGCPESATECYPVNSPAPPSERPLRCAAVMSCAEAFALMEGVGYVAW